MSMLRGSFELATDEARLMDVCAASWVGGETLRLLLLVVLTALVDMLAVEAVVGAMDGWREGAPEYVLERTSSRRVWGRLVEVVEG